MPVKKIGPRSISHIDRGPTIVLSSARVSDPAGRPFRVSVISYHEGMQAQRNRMNADVKGIL